MKRNVTLTLAILFLAAAAPALAARPFGAFGGNASGNGATGVVAVHGWALDDDGVAWVDILVDGVVAGRAMYGRSRPGVAQRFPGFPDSAAAGFAFQLDTTHFLNGRHTVTARVRSRTGERVDLRGRVLDFFNETHALAPFGAIEFPRPNVEMAGTCNLGNTARRFSVVSGYALDAGVQDDDHGVGYVELLLDGSILANSRTSCFFDAGLGGLVDCYGLRRLDIERFFPTLRNAPQSGFRFVLDVGLLLNLGYTPGFHQLSIRAGDHFGTVREIAKIPVSFRCGEDLPDDLSFGDIDIPLHGLVYSGTATTHGWALDFQGVNAVLVLVDGTAVGTATLGFARPGVSALYPGFPESAAPGWRFDLDTTELSDGRHGLQVVVHDDAGNTTLIGERPFTVDNER